MYQPSAPEDVSYVLDLIIVFNGFAPPKIIAADSISPYQRLKRALKD